MSNVKISQLPVATSLTGAEVVPLVQSGGTVQVAVSVFVDYLQDPGYFRAFPGTVSVVSYSFKDTPNTGIYSPATGQLGLVTVGAERLRIDASGNVGIGTSAPTSKLDVAGTVKAGVENGVSLLLSRNSAIRDESAIGSTMYFDVAVGSASHGAFDFRSSNAYLSRLYIAANGNVGIGTNAPAQKLTIFDASTAGFVLQGSTTQFFVFSYSGFATMGTISNTPLLLYTNNTERLRIDASGNVGIGTSAPVTIFSLGGSAPKISLLNNGVYNGELGLGVLTGFGDAIGIHARQATGQIVFGINSVERLRIDASGNVRVGTAALATTATDGFLYVPTCPGTPTGVPTAITGLAPIVINSTNNKLYFYSGGAWRDAGP